MSAHRAPVVGLAHPGSWRDPFEMVGKDSRRIKLVIAADRACDRDPSSFDRAFARLTEHLKGRLDGAQGASHRDWICAQNATGRVDDGPVRAKREAALGE